MVITISVYRIFISSPSDVSQERAVAEEAIYELNPIIQKSLGIIFEPIRWETNVIPGLSPSGAQGVIDEQTPDDYEIYLGILGARFGTPAGQASSGTEHEFQTALNRWKEDSLSVRIMFYFKNSSGKLSDIDPDQLKKVLEFKHNLEKIGLYKEFQDPNQLKELLRTDLFLLAKQLVGDPKQPEPELKVDIKDEGVEDAILEDEAGFLDLLEAGSEEFRAARDLLDEITGVTQTLGSDIQSGTAEITQANQETKGPKVLKAIINKVADSLTVYSLAIREKSPKISLLMESGLSHYGRANTLLLDFEGNHAERLQESIDATTGILNSINGAYEKIEGLREAIAKSPRATTKFNHARTEVIQVLDSLLIELIKVSESASYTLATLETNLKNIKP